MENIEKKITAIVPTYNREKTIVRCLDSIVNQSVLPYEIIVVDDGSVDETVSLVEDYIDEHTVMRIKLIKSEHKGAQAARNIGIKAASGDWIAFLDSDDEWCPNRLEVALDKLGNREDVIVYGTCLRYDGNTQELWRLPTNSGYIYLDLLFHPWPMLPGMLISKKMFEEIGYLDEKCPSFQEWETSIRLATNYLFEYVDEPLFIYYVDSAVTTISSDKAREYKGYKYVFFKHIDEIIEKKSLGCLIHHYKVLSNLADDANKVAICEIISELEKKKTSIAKIALETFD